MPSRIVRVSPAALGWSMQSDGLPAPLHFATLDAAIAAGWHYARKQHIDLEICRENGTVRLRSAGMEDAPARTPWKEGATPGEHRHGLKVMS